MSLHYNAFISYRHHPDDIRVASQIHRSLERFHVPRALRKKTGKIDRLFRDKEELPITSNLNDDIGEALRNSDYLIVICSVHTKESIWVQREIELFLSTHPRERVLTVLASGEPYDVIPEILLYEEITDPVTGEKTRRDYEPLSCDWRGNLRKAKRDELPRLAAPLLGCAYDELRQRQKQYRARRAMIISSVTAAASLCLAAYFLYTSITIRNANIRIAENLEQALHNQSMHLATAAHEKLAQGDRMTALSLAVAALPQEDAPRPYVAEAEYVLSDGLGVYRMNSQSAAVGTVGPGGSVIVRQFLPAGGDTVYLRDSRQIITAWNTDTLSQSGSIDLRGQSFRTMLTSGENLLVQAGKFGTSLSCYRPDGTQSWTLEDCYDIAITDDGTLLVLAKRELLTLEVRFLDPATGLPLRDALPVGTAVTQPLCFATRRFENTDALAIHFGSAMSRDLRIVDTATGTAVLAAGAEGVPEAVCLTGDKLLVMHGALEDSFMGIFEDSRITTPVTNPVSCYDLQGTLLWQTQIVASGSTSISIAPIPESDRVLIQSGAVILVTELADGSTAARCDAGSGILSILPGTTQADAVLEDGYTCTYRYATNDCFEQQTLRAGLTQALQTESGCLGLHPEEGFVTVVRTLNSQALWEYQFEQYLTPRQWVRSDTLLAVADYGNVYLVDISARGLKAQAALATGDLLGFSSDGSTLYIGSADAVQTMDTSTGELTPYPLPDAEIDGQFFFKNDRLLYTVGAELVCINTADGSAVRIALEEAFSGHIAAAAGQWVWLWQDTGALLEADLSALTCRTAVTGLEFCPGLALREDGDLLAAAAGQQLYLLTPGQKGALCRTLEEPIGSAVFRGEELLTLNDSGTVCRLDAQLRVLSRTQLTMGDTFGKDLRDDPNGVQWCFTEDGRLIVIAFGFVNVIDCRQWTVCADLNSCMGYFPGSDGFLCRSGSRFVFFPRHSTKSLLALAAQELGSFDLSAQEKAAYGIEIQAKTEDVT